MTRFHAVLALTLAVTAARGQTVDEIIALVKGGLSEDTIRAQIEVTGTRYTLEPAQLLTLKEAGVPESLIQAMIRTATPGAPTPAPVSAPAIDAELDRQIADVRAALREPRYSIDRWNQPPSWYWDGDGWYGYGAYPYGYGYPVLGFAHYGGVYRGYRSGYGGGFYHGTSPGFVYRRGNFGFSFGTNFSGGGGSFFRFRFR